MMTKLSGTEFSAFGIYDIKADPKELNNLIGHPESKPVIAMTIKVTVPDRRKYLANLLTDLPRVIAKLSAEKTAMYAREISWDRYTPTTRFLTSLMCKISRSL